MSTPKPSRKSGKILYSEEELAEARTRVESWWKPVHYSSEDEDHPSDEEEKERWVRKEVRMSRRRAKYARERKVYPTIEHLFKKRGQIGNAKEWYDQLPSRQQNRTYQEARKVYERDFDAHFPLSPSVHESSGSSEAPSSEDSYEKEDRREGNRERRGIQTWLRYRRDHPRAFGYRPRPTPIQPFNFMGLPVEIRCEILRLLLERDKLLTDISPNATYESYKMVPVDTCLFAVSRQMHADAQAVFFRSNTFRVRISGIGILGLPFFIEYPPPSTEDFRKFHLSIFHHSQPLTQPRLTERLETVIDMLKECKQLIQLKILQFGDHSDFTKIPQNIFEDSLEFFTQVQGVKQVILSDSEPPNDDYYSPIVAPEKVLTRLETIMQSPKAEQGSIVRKRFLPLEKRLKRG